MSDDVKPEGNGAPKEKKHKSRRVAGKVRDRAPSLAPWKFPKNTLEDTLSVAKALEEKFAGNPTKADQLVKAIGFNKETDWRFQDLLKSGALYGITSGSGAAATVILEKLGEDIVSPSSSEQRQKALLAAFRKVSDFAAVETFYKGKKIPEDEFFGNTLIRQFNIPRDRVQTFSKVFLANLSFLKAFRVTDVREEPEGTPSQKMVDASISTPERRNEGVREFLDTCFVMMPFGEWYDVYYKEIYIPAIKEAGFEPVRADELFSSGSVVEQIWEQIDKAKVLLADLTGKNANVFYELGLAHADRKPVVFTSGVLEDVPFDLRHLRVIIYDIREPSWNQKLKTNITAYLKNAKTDPAKSIPQPFRDMEGPTKG
ncbi:MAG: hypothetical protein MUO85_00985 [candidate division Zixibacteria bacterium]|nr:hypothetical protein [candidate division Zixibacteria bacterium]